MKNILLVLSVITISCSWAYVSPRSQQYKNANSDCLKSLGVRVNKNGNPVNKTDTRLKCLEQCILTQVGTIQANGDPILSTFNTQTRDIATICANKARQYIDNACRRAKSFDKCLRNQIKPLENERMVNECYTIDYTKIDPKIEENACNVRCYLLDMRKLDGNNVLLHAVLDDPYNTQGNQKLKQCNDQYKNDTICLQAARRYSCILNSVKGNNNNGVPTKPQNNNNNNNKPRVDDDEDDGNPWNDNNNNDDDDPWNNNNDDDDPWNNNNDDDDPWNNNNNDDDPWNNNNNDDPWNNNNNDDPWNNGW